MKNQLMISLLSIVLVLCILLALMALSADDWELMPIQITTNQIQFSTTVLSGKKQVAFRVVGVGPTSKSLPSDASQALIVVAQGTPQSVIDSLKSKGYAVAIDGVSTIRAIWDASTYTVMTGDPPTQETVEVTTYELYFKEVAEVGACTKPGTMSLDIN